MRKIMTGGLSGLAVLAAMMSLGGGAAHEIHRETRPVGLKQRSKPKPQKRRKDERAGKEFRIKGLRP